MATEKQKKAIDNLVESGGSVSGAMRDAGYSDKTAKTPKKLTESKAFKELYDKYIPDELLLEKHKALLNKEEVVTKNNVTTGEVDVIPTGQIDTQAVKAGLDMAYKVKGNYAAEKKEITMEITEENKKKAEEAVEQFLSDE
jgi:ATP:corrinoid adenosyltransferase